MGKWDIFQIFRNFFLRKFNVYGYKFQIKILYLLFVQFNNREVNLSVVSLNYMFDVKQEFICRSVVLQKIWFDMLQSYNVLYIKEIF